MAFVTGELYLDRVDSVGAQDEYDIFRSLELCSLREMWHSVSFARQIFAFYNELPQAFHYRNGKVSKYETKSKLFS